MNLKEAFRYQKFLDSMMYIILVALCNTQDLSSLTRGPRPLQWTCREVLVSCVHV